MTFCSAHPRVCDAAEQRTLPTCSPTNFYQHYLRKWVETLVGQHISSGLCSCSCDGERLVRGIAKVRISSKFWYFFLSCGGVMVATRITETFRNRIYHPFLIFSMWLSLFSSHQFSSLGYPSYQSSTVLVLKLLHAFLSKDHTAKSSLFALIKIQVFTKSWAFFEKSREWCV